MNARRQVQRASRAVARFERPWRRRRSRVRRARWALGVLLGVIAVAAVLAYALYRGLLGDRDWRRD